MFFLVILLINIYTSSIIKRYIKAKLRLSYSLLAELIVAIAQTKLDDLLDDLLEILSVDCFSQTEPITVPSSFCELHQHRHIGSRYFVYTLYAKDLPLTPYLLGQHCLCNALTSLPHMPTVYA